MVTGASRGSAATLVAANLAAALARTGSEVVLIGAHLPDSVVDAAPLARMLGVSAVPGLSDLLAGRVGPGPGAAAHAAHPVAAGDHHRRHRHRGRADAVAAAARHPRGAAPAGRLRGHRGALDRSSADAQSLASLADAAILAVELRRARRPALPDAAEQLRRVGTPLLGAVVLPRLAAPARPPTCTGRPSR